MPNTEILIVSYLKDKDWLEFNLRSIEKFARGFSSVTVVVPQPEWREFLPLTVKHHARLHLFNPDPAGRGHSEHLIMKLKADLICPKADFILHTDSDCVFCEPVRPEDYFQGGKPELLVEEWGRVGAAAKWRGGTDKALGIKSRYETMRRHPAVNYRGIYPELRLRIERANHMPFEQYVFAHPPHGPEPLSEFNAIGNYVLHTHWAGKYHIIDTGKQPAPPSSRKLIQFWSCSPPNQPQKSPNDGRLMTPATVVNELLA